MRRRRPPRSPLPALGALLALVTVGVASAQAPVSVIPPGREALFADMLGKGAALPGGCAWAGANIEPVAVTSRYGCAGGEVVLELRNVADAPPTAMRTASFALLVKSGAPPPGLVDAIAARVRSLEAAPTWVEVEAAAPPPAEPSVRWGLPVALAVGLVAAVASAIAAARWTRGRPPSTAARALGVVAGAALIACAAVHGALRGLGGVLLASRPGGGVAALVGSAALMLGGVLVAVAATAIVGRARGRAQAAAILAGVAALYVACGYPRGLPPDDLHRFGPLTTMPPGQPAGTASDLVNAQGFRGPSFALAKPPGTVRVALVGDSFVFGSGVEGRDTIAVNLGAALGRRWPAARIEVLNLGIPGNNLGSHVDLYQAAAERLDPDVVVLGLTLVNDLSPWDGQTERRDGRRPSAFSFARFLVGDAAGLLWTSALEARAVSPRTLAFLDTELGRLARLRAQAPSRPALVLLTWGPADPAIESRLVKLGGATRAPVASPPLTAFIPGDGHPTPLGTRLFAGWAADGIAASEAAPLFR